MIQLIIEADNSSDLLEKLFGLAKALSGKDSDPVSDAVAYVAAAADDGEDVEYKIPVPAAAVEEKAVVRVVEADDVRTPDYEAVRTSIREILAVLLAGANAPKAMAELRKYGPNVSAVPYDKLDGVLAALEQLK